MCLAIPMKVTELLPEEKGVVEADGISMEVSMNLLSDVSVGDYVIVHTGFALELIDQVEAEKTLELFREVARTRENSPEL
ncbi:HypC/HybG/HupF family hydrogenase formation chaperone [Candidatus Latescibacterota bacterium]